MAESKEPSTTPLTYFNNAGKTPLPLESVRVGQAVLENYHTNPGRVNGETESAEGIAEDVRELYAKLIGARSTDIALTPSVSFAMSMAARNLELTGVVKEGSKILVLQDEMSSEVYCWQDVCQRVKCELEAVPYPVTKEGTEPATVDGWTEAILERLNAETPPTVLCIPQAHWADGSLIDIDAVSRKCREREVFLLLDATQSVGIVPDFDVSRWDVDFVAVAVHKWLLGAYGTGLVYLAPRHQSTWQPIDHHERTREGIDNALYWDVARNFMNPTTGYPSAFQPGARRLDSGGRPSPLAFPILRQSLRQVLQLDLSDCQERLHRITDSIVQGAKPLGFDVNLPGVPRVGQIVGLRPSSPALVQKLTQPPSQMVELVKRLRENHNVFVMVRVGCIRVSPYIDTTAADVERLLEALRVEIEKL